MRAETILPGESREEYQRRLENWMEDYEVSTPSQYYIVERTVKSSWKLDRGDRVEVALATRLMRGVEREAERREGEEADQLVARLAEGKEVRGIVRQLRTLPAGCHWMLEQWGIITTHLESYGGVFLSQGRMVLHLLGKRMEDLFTGDPVVVRWFMTMASSSRCDDEPITAEQTEALFDRVRPDDIHPDEYDERVKDLLVLFIDRAEARVTLRTLIDGAIAELEQHLIQVVEQAKQDRALDVECAQIDLTPEGARVLKYVATNDRSYHSMLRRLDSEKKSSRPGPDRGGPGPGEGPTTTEVEPEPDPNETLPGFEPTPEPDPVTTETISEIEPTPAPEPEPDTTETISGIEPTPAPERVPDTTETISGIEPTPAPEPEPDTTETTSGIEPTPAPVTTETISRPGPATAADLVPVLRKPEPDDMPTQEEEVRIAPEIAILRRPSRQRDAFYGFTSAPGDLVVTSAPEPRGGRNAEVGRGPPGESSADR